MSSWISGEELIARWKIKEVDLFDYLKMGLRPYSKYGRRLNCLKPHHEYYHLWHCLDVIKRDLRNKEICINPFVSIADPPPHLPTEHELKLKKAKKLEDIKEKQQLEKLYKDILARINTILKDDPYIISWKYLSNETLTETEAEKLLSKLKTSLFQINKVLNFEKNLDIPTNIIESDTNLAKDREHDETLISFYKQGRDWMIGKRGSEERIQDLKGVGQIHLLLDADGNELSPLYLHHLGKIPSAEQSISGQVKKGLEGVISPEDLLKTDANEGGKANENFSEQPIYDQKYIESIGREIERKKMASEVTTDPQERMEIEPEIRQLEKVIKSIQKNRNKFESHSDANARTGVQKNIKKALQTIIQTMPYLNAYLNDKTVVTGAKCYYKTNPALPVSWLLSKGV